LTVLQRGNPSIEPEADAEFRHIGFGNQDWCADIDLWTPGVLGLDFDAARLRLRDRILEHLLVELDTDLLDVAGLLVAEQIACPANVQVVTGESETGAER